MSDTKFYHFTSDSKFSIVESLPDAIQLLNRGGFVWLNYTHASREELSGLIDPFYLHSLSIEDCTDDSQVPKIENFPKNTFILFNAMRYVEKKVEVDEVDLFIGENFLITVSGYNSEVEPLKEMGQIITQNIENACQGPAFLMHIILDNIVDQKFIAIEALEDELDASEESLLENPEGFNPAQLVGLRKDLMALRKSLFHEREILVKICRGDCPFISGKAIFHYRDIYDHLSKFFELAETYRDIVTSLMELYMSMLNNLMNRAAHTTNSSVRRLTLITTIFMPLTLLAGIGGMSEWSMMTGPNHWKITYPLFLLAMVGIGFISYMFLKKLEKKDM